MTIPMQWALRRRMMMSALGSGEALISDLPLGALIRIADSDGGNGAANYEIADINNLVPGGVVLVRKNIYSRSKFGSTTNYPNGTLDNLIGTTIYNKMPQKLRDKMMDISFNLSGSGDITRKMFALTYTMAGFGDNGDVTEGKALQLYTSDASRKKTFNGSASSWWLSSRYSSDYVRFVASGGAVQLLGPSNESGVVPAFAIPGDALCNATPNPDGSYKLLQNTTISTLSITYTGAHTDYGMVTMSDGARYRLLAFTSSGTLSIEQPVNCEVCVVGGGANGANARSSGPGAGGAGAYLKNQVIEAFKSGAVVVGAAQGVSSIGGVSVAAVAGTNGGTGAGSTTGGTGDGISKYPFEDTGYSLWAGKPHCGGGGQGANDYYGQGMNGGNGGTNGGNGYPRGSNWVSPPSGGVGGSYGGGAGGTTGNGGNATYYGSGAGGGRYYEDSRGNQTFYNGGSGYQGIVYMRIPAIQ